MKKTSKKSQPRPTKPEEIELSGTAPVKNFGRAFFAQVPAEDTARLTGEELSAVAAVMHARARVRKKGRNNLAVYSPDGFSFTAIEIVGDDMPFIVDSVTAHLAHKGFRIETMFHPMLTVARDAAGAIKACDSPDARLDGGMVESLMYLQLEDILPPKACAALAEELLSVLDDVRLATSDWKPMLRKMEDVILAVPAEQGDVEALEARALLSYLRANNFTFLGYRRCRFAEKGKIQVETKDSLGLARSLLKDLPPVPAYAAALRGATGAVLVTKMIDRPSTVHRRVPLDVISVKIADGQGRLTGMHQFVGLFTSSTYSCRTSEVPVVRRKVQATIARSKFREGGHDRKALEHILEKMPRDELFQVSDDALYSLSHGIMRLEGLNRVALFAHADPLGEYMSCLAYAPRDRFNSLFRARVGQVLEEALGGRVINYFTTLDDSPLARMLFTIGLESGRPRAFDVKAVEQHLIDLAREWDERLLNALVSARGRKEGAALGAIYGRAFSASYHDTVTVQAAVRDVAQLEALEKNGETLRVDLYKPDGGPEGEARLKLYSRNAVALSDIMPVLENMGFLGLSELSHQVKPAGHPAAWVHEFRVSHGKTVDVERVKPAFEEAFLQVWSGQIENDRFNQLVVDAGLNWREALLLRAYGGFIRQARFPYAAPYMAQVLCSYPAIARSLADLFAALHDPSASRAGAKAVGARLDALLQKVERADHDRILRLFRLLVERTLRTNYYQKGKPCLSFKLDSPQIDGLPLPRPFVEIYVYSPRVEGIHLRGGRIARGGIRWSDRPDDFRTEVLGLVKAQMVKNTVIVPTGAKGGFVVKKPPQARDAYQQEGIACYQIFVQALLDITDNDVKGKMVRPKDVVCHDGPDPYLVVAADKGTAKFSDIANALSVGAGFWLGDAFASGGSTGYDHKGIGITARGGWESVKRHFHALGKDIQKEPFLVTGVGDMGGDVFGNAMLLSRQIRLIGAFNHVHIFCDPEPDAAVSFAERERLFNGVLGWDSYDTKKLSPGGGVFDRKAKSIRLSPQIRKRFGIDQEVVAPDELVKAILKAETELLWLGGIGTFVKAASQAHADADDKANDSTRIDGGELRAKVVGEGANLGFTQLGRIEYARRGGRINTDFIDNSAGVDCSDHEVNIKILLSDVMARKKLTLPRRNKLLKDMTEDVAALVLRDNYQQTQSLAFQLVTARETLPRHADLIRALEKDNLIRRALEGLPDEEAMARLTREGAGLTVPELCVLTSWAKIALYNQVIESDIPDDPSLEWMLFDYFPERLRVYKAEIKAHKLRREIIATQVVNILVNRMGPVFARSRVEKTGAPLMEAVKAFIVVMEAFGLRDAWAAIEALDGRVAAAVQTAAQEEVFDVCKRAVTWLLRFGPDKIDVSREIEAFGPGIAQLRAKVGQFLPAQAAAALSDLTSRLVLKGVPQALARDLSTMDLLSSACDIIAIARRTRKDLGQVARVHFAVGERLLVDWVRAQASAIDTQNGWQARIVGSLLDDCHIHQAAVTGLILKSGKAPAAWFAAHETPLLRVDQTLAEMRAQPKTDLDMLVLAGQRVGQFVSAL